MSQSAHVPSLPLDHVADLSAVTRLAGHLAAAAFVAGILVMSAQIMTFTPSADADCLPEICGPALSR